MKRRLNLVAAILGCLATTFVVSAAIAEVAPQRGAADSRVRFVRYSPVDVVSINAVRGVSTMIVFSEKEKIETIAVGDSSSWKIEPNKRSNIIFIKPMKLDATSNMNVVSDKRVYSFVLNVLPDNARNQTFVVKFRYPDEDLDQKLLEQAKRDVAKPNLSRIIKNELDNVNDRYSYSGDEELRPTSLFDDGVKTWFRFDGDVPAMFIVEDGKREILANYRREGDYIVIDKIATQWMLRRDHYATCIFNGEKTGTRVAVRKSAPSGGR